MNDKAIKFDEGKPRFDLIPGDALEQLAILYTRGAQKYEANNWLKGKEYGSFFAALQRHAWKWKQGEDIDEETGVNHMAAVAWNAIALLTYQLRDIGEDDRK